MTYETHGQIYNGLYENLVNYEYLNEVMASLILKIQLQTDNW
jgi:hypothetical protein